MTPECNADAVVVLFRPFSALRVGRIVGGVVLCLVVLTYTWLVVTDYRAGMSQDQKIDGAPIDTENLNIRMDRNPDTHSRNTPIHAQMPVVPDVQMGRQSVRTSISIGVPPGFDVGYDTRLAGRMLSMLSIITVTWVLVVVNTELLIRWNHFQPTTSSQWQFGQVRLLLL